MIYILIFLLFVNNLFAKEVAYDILPPLPHQSIRDYAPLDYKPLLSKEYQEKQWLNFYKNYYGKNSPWAFDMVNKLLPNIFKIENDIVNIFDNSIKNSILYLGLNYQPYPNTWLKNLKQTMQLNTFNYVYQEKNRAIAVSNTLLRVLPNIAPAFFDASIPGQGYPFDNLQDSAIWAGTPLYIVGQSTNHEWSLVITPDAYFSWVQNSDIARVSDSFVNEWRRAAKLKTAAITKNQVSILDFKTHEFKFNGYIGAIFPLIHKKFLMIPVKNSNDMAEIHQGIIPSNSMNVVPLLASKKSLMDIIGQLKNRPYGWGGMLFFNDCSQEMKSIFTPFGIWLPRNSVRQSQLNGARDLSHLNIDDRLQELKKSGHPFMTLIYIGKHVMLYVGQYNFKDLSNKPVLMTYQNVWGLRSRTKNWRYVIGKSVFLPLEKSFKSNPDLDSQASSKDFILVNLDSL